jgi:cytochrome c oxidase cbb3-type subunit 3/ubiquinol-cytochrome c reductase cytochrome c subunit
MNAPGHPAPGPEVPRPEQVLDFANLYKQNCAGCHGENGKNGVAMALADPVYLAVAGEANVHQVIAKGVAGKLMPAFERSAGGALTDQQVDSLVQGIFQSWSRPGAANVPPYAAAAKSDPARGQKAFAEFCGHCHGADGNGQNTSAANAVSGSIVDSSYLALVSDQSLRGTIIAGRPDLGMPDWRSDGSGPSSHAMTDQEITDVVAWLAAHRTASQE